MAVRLSWYDFASRTPTWRATPCPILRSQVPLYEQNFGSNRPEPVEVPPERFEGGAREVV